MIRYVNDQELKDLQKNPNYKITVLQSSKDNHKVEVKSK